MKTVIAFLVLLSGVWALETPAGEFTYDEEIQLRELRMEKDEIYERMKRGPLSRGDGYVLAEEIESINEQIRDIRRSAAARDDN